MSYIQYPQSALDQWVVTASTTGANSASASKAAGAAGVRHVARRAVISFAVGATAQTPLAVNLRDGATGAGTVLMAFQLALSTNATSGPVNQVIDLDNINLAGTAATAMCLEQAAAPVANTGSSVNLIGYDLGVRPVALPVAIS